MWMIAPAIGFLVLIVFLQFFPIGLWITALASGVPGVTPFVLIGMKLRKVPQDKIVLPLIAIQQFALMNIRNLTEENKMYEMRYRKLIIRSMFGIINAARNSA